MPPKRKATFNPEAAKETSKKVKLKKDALREFEEAEQTLVSAAESMSLTSAGIIARIIIVS